jgi:hypothetical protein
VSRLPDWMQGRWGLVMLAVVAVFAADRSPGASLSTPGAGARAASPAGSAQARAAKGADEAAARRLLELAQDGAPIAAQRRALASTLRTRGVSDTTVAAVMDHADAGITLFKGDEHARSRLGGGGILPAGADWPRGDDASAMTFLARLDLAELPGLPPLPAAGTLLFFLGQSSATLDPYANARVLWAPPGTVLREASADAQRLQPVPLRGVAMPIAGEPMAVDQMTDHDRRQERLFNVMNDMAGTLYHHQLLGSSRDVQGPVLDEIAYWLKESASTESRSHFTPSELAGRGWSLLAQFDEDDEAQLTLADGGSAFFVLPTADLEAHRFDRAMAIVQSH